jgi:hypothetical protein
MGTGAVSDSSAYPLCVAQRRDPNNVGWKNQVRFKELDCNIRKNLSPFVVTTSFHSPPPDTQRLGIGSKKKKNLPFKIWLPTFLQKKVSWIVPSS